MTKRGEKVLLIYSAIASTAFLFTLLTVAASVPHPVFDEIQVHRINIVEPDGTLRMVISNRNRLPGVIVRGNERPLSDRPQAGMLFYNDEGSETGGLIFGGHKNSTGQVVDCCGSLSFDRYGANQIVQLAGVDDVTDQFMGVSVKDSRQRIWVGRKGDGAATISLMDGSGKPRIVLSAPSSGSPTREFFDESGKVVQRLVPESK